MAIISQEGGQYPVIMSEQAWSIKNVLSAIIRKQRDTARNREQTR